MLTESTVNRVKLQLYFILHCEIRKKNQNNRWVHFLFTVVINRLTAEFGQEFLWTVMFAETLSYSERREPGEVEVCSGEQRDESQ